MTKQQTRLSLAPTNLDTSTSFLFGPSSLMRERAIQEGSKVTNRDWVNNWSYINLVISDSNQLKFFKLQKQVGKIILNYNVCR